MQIRLQLGFETFRTQDIDAKVLQTLRTQDSSACTKTLVPKCLKILRIFNLHTHLGTYLLSLILPIPNNFVTSANFAIQLLIQTQLLYAGTVST